MAVQGKAIEGSYVIVLKHGADARAVTASSVYAYVIDTGIYTAHTQFGGRACNVCDVFGGNGQDCNGHGTHVSASTVYTTIRQCVVRHDRELDQQQRNGERDLRQRVRNAG